MPHDGFDDCTCAAVVQAVGCGASRTLLVQATSPKRCRAAPSRTDVIDHVQSVLHHVGVGPNLLVRIARHDLRSLSAAENVGVGHHIFACGPRRTVAVGAPNLLEQPAASLYLGVVYVARSRHGQSAVPHQQVHEFVVGHLDRQVLGRQVILDALLHGAVPPGRVCFVGVHLGDVGIKALLYLGIAGRIGGIGAGRIQIVVASVRTGHIGNVPDGVGTGTVEQRATAHGIGEAPHVGRPISLQAVGVEVLPRAVFKHGGVQPIGQEAVAFLLGPLCHNVRLVDGIEQAAAVDADGTLQADFIGTKVAKSLIVDIDSLGRQGDFGVLQVIRFAVGKSVAPFVGGREPLHLYFAFVERRLEGCDGMALRHTGQPRHISVGFGIVDSQQATVARVFRVKMSFGDALAMAIAGMAVHARGADIGRTESAAHARWVAHEGFFEKGLPIQERSH